MRWGLYAGVGAVGALLAWVLARTPSSAAPSAEPPSTPGAPHWVELTDPFVLLFTGDRYRCCVDVPGIVPNSLVRSEILKRAPGVGFKDVSVLDAPPPGFGGKGGDCDLFVEAVWNGADGARVDRHARISGAWRLTRA